MITEHSSRQADKKIKNREKLHAPHLEKGKRVTWRHQLGIARDRKNDFDLYILDENANEKGQQQATNLREDVRGINLYQLETGDIEALGQSGRRLHIAGSRQERCSGIIAGWSRLSKEVDHCK